LRIIIEYEKYSDYMISAKRHKLGYLTDIIGDWYTLIPGRIGPVNLFVLALLVNNIPQTADTRSSGYRYLLILI
jgi:hypothetical protein